MKYIRLFENKIQDKIDSLKKFVVIDISIGIFKQLYIVEIINKTPFTIKYKYDLLNNETRITNVVATLNHNEYEDWLDKIIYQTDTLQDAIDMLPILNVSDKYNL